MIESIKMSKEFFTLAADETVSLTPTGLMMLQSEKNVRFKMMKAILSVIINGFRTELGSFLESISAEKTKNSPDRLTLTKQSTIFQLNQTIGQEIRRNFTRMLDKAYRDQIADHPDLYLNVSIDKI